MKASAKDLLSEIPDFPDFIKLTEEISALLLEKLKLDAEIKYKESVNFKTVSTDEQFFQNGKPPTATYIENTYKYPGLTGELQPYRLRLAEVTAELEQKKLKLDIWKNMIEVWRTVSASERSSIT